MFFVSTGVRRLSIVEFVRLPSLSCVLGTAFSVLGFCPEFSLQRSPCCSFRTAFSGLHFPGLCSSIHAHRVEPPRSEITGSRKNSAERGVIEPGARRLEARLPGVCSTDELSIAERRSGLRSVARSRHRSGRGSEPVVLSRGSDLAEAVSKIAFAIFRFVSRSSRGSVRSR